MTPNTFIRSVWKRLATVRKFKGLTQKQVASAIGITPIFLCLVEKGKRTWSIQLYIDLCEEMEVPISAIFSEREYKSDVPFDVLMKLFF